MVPGVDMSPENHYRNKTCPTQSTIEKTFLFIIVVLRKKGFLFKEDVTIYGLNKRFYLTKSKTKYYLNSVVFHNVKSF